MSWPQINNWNDLTTYSLEESHKNGLDDFLNHTLSADLAKTLSNTPINHLGGLLHGEVEDIRTGLQERGYTITDSFPSTIVAKELSDKYGKEIPIHIFLCTKEGKLYEYFVIPWENIDEMIEEWGKVLHVAYKFTDDVSSREHISHLVMHMKGNGFVLGYSGVNAKQNNGQGATTIYMIKKLSTDFQLKVEIIADGLHPEFITYIENLYVTPKESDTTVYLATDNIDSENKNGCNALQLIDSLLAGGAKVVIDTQANINAILNPPSIPIYTGRNTPGLMKDRANKEKKS